MPTLCPERQHQLAVIRESEFFDWQWYASQYPDVVSLGMEPPLHYIWIGADLGRDPGPDFDTSFYLDQYPDVAKSGLNPLFHYLSSGRDQGRTPKGVPGSTRSERTTGSAQFRIDRTASVSPDDDWLIFVAYCPEGRLSECQKYQLSSFRSAGYRIALVINSDTFANLTNPGAAECDVQIVRENVGFDFGAWRHAIELLGGLAEARSVTFTNDSIFPISADDTLAHLRERLSTSAGSVTFLTRNLEVRPHSQSYFFRLGREALARDAAAVLTGIPYYVDKHALIHEVEVHLEDKFAAAGFQADVLFPMDGVEENPTIHHWEELLSRGFPFAKVQLVTAGLLRIDDSRLTSLLEPQVHQWLADHCERRAAGGATTQIIRNVPPVPALPGCGRFNEYGAQQAFNPPAQQNPVLKVPVDDIERQPPSIPSIIAIVHAFYVDIAAEILGDLARLEIPMRIVLTTDSEEKASALEAELVRLELVGETIVCPNRGRDVAPFLIEGSRFADEAGIFLHLHTKKSPHDSIYADWGKYLRRNLVGSRASVLSILKLFQDTDVGLAFSDHFREVVGLRNWGFDFAHAQGLLGRLEIQIDADSTLEFPTSTMFWARREALEPLFKAGLTYEDFEEEAGQIDGTLAHAIERSLLYVTQSAGLSYIKVTADEEPTELGAPLLRLAVSDLSYALDRPSRFLPGDSAVRSEFDRAVPEVYPVSVARSRRKKPRLTALLPTMKPEKIYGGITTALKVLGQIRDELPDDVDLRVLITSDSVDASSVAELGGRLNRSFAWVMPDDDPEGDTIVGVAESQHIPISVRAGEFYLATAWWTADLGFRLMDRHQAMHGQSTRLAYIIQDYEPGFYNWSNTYALAEATYLRGEQTAAIINSEELADYMAARYSFAYAGCVPYELHPKLAELIKPTKPERTILVYGRPGVSRNCFELLCEGLRVWQSRHPAESQTFDIVFAGEDFDPNRISGLLNARNVGKMSVEAYAEMLNRSAVGISLMVSPHPSYPPLEMANAGCITITNRYDGKDLSQRAENIVSLESLTPARVADAIEEALLRVRYNDPKEVGGVKRLESALQQADFAQVANWLLSAS